MFTERHSLLLLLLLVRVISVIEFQFQAANYLELLCTSFFQKYAVVIVQKTHILNGFLIQERSSITEITKLSDLSESIALTFFITLGWQIRLDTISWPYCTQWPWRLCCYRRTQPRR